MTTTIFKEFRFEAAHFLPNVPPGHQCGRMHGHSYRIIIGVTGPVDPETGFVIDFGQLKTVVKPVVDLMDHSVLNDLLQNPTCELLAQHIWNLICPELQGLAYVEAWETATAGCRFDAVSR